MEGKSADFGDHHLTLAVYSRIVVPLVGTGIFQAALHADSWVCG